MKLHILLFLSLVSVGGCSSNISSTELDDLKKPIVVEAFEKYLLKKYKKRGSYDLVYMKDNADEDNLRFNPYQNLGNSFSLPVYLKDCMELIPISSNDINSKYSIIRGWKHTLSDSYKFDNSKFSSCLDVQLKKTALSYDNLIAFANDKEIQEYKAKNPAIADMLVAAKDDGVISINEALEIYLAVYKAKEELTFNKI